MPTSAKCVTLQDVSAGGNSAPATFVFTDSLFAGATVTLGPDNFPSAVTESLVGDVLTLSMSEFVDQSRYPSGEGHGMVVFLIGGGTGQAASAAMFVGRQFQGSSSWMRLAG